MKEDIHRHARGEKSLVIGSRGAHPGELEGVFAEALGGGCGPMRVSVRARGKGLGSGGGNEAAESCRRDAPPGQATDAAGHDGEAAGEGFEDDILDAFPLFLLGRQRTSAACM